MTMDTTVTATNLSGTSGPAAVWWFERDGRRVGPVTADELGAHVLALDVTPDTLVWRSGMSDWLRMDAVPELAALRQTVRLATGGPRYLARLVDIVFVFTLSGAVYSLIFALYMGTSPMSAFPDNPWLMPIVITGSQPLLDALIAAVFGNTPGKALLGIRVIDGRGKPLSFVRYFLRNLLVGSFATGFGIGIFGIAAQAWQFVRVKRGEPTVYDAWINGRVLGRPVSAGKIARCVLAAVASIVLWFFATQVAHRVSADERAKAVVSHPVSRDAQAPASTAASPSPPVDASFIWRNPITQTAVRIDGAWIYTEANNRTGDRVSLFSTEDGNAQIILGTDTVSKASLAQYAQNFVKQNSDRYAFEDAGRIVRAGMGSKWVGVARSRRFADMRMQFEIVQRGPRFWYLMVALDKPYDKHARLTDTLRETLLKSIGEGNDGAL